MNRARKSSKRFQEFVFSLAAGLLLTAGFAASAEAADYQNLPVVKPVMSCGDLAKADLSKIADAKITIKSATVRDTDKGSYCRVIGEVEPGSVGFRAELPIEHWTQRYLQSAQGREGIERAGGCMPALNGEIAVATAAGGGIVNPPGNPWGDVPDSRINWAYRNNHMTAVAVKNVIKIFYGVPQKFAYMLGCSEGGRQTLNEAQRFPNDFDGVSVGAPVVYDTPHNIGLWHGWEYHVNQRADGSIILAKERLSILHDAAITHCAAVSGLIDSMLQQPTACKFAKSWVQCAAGTTETSKCLTTEETTVAEQLYLGPNDGKGNFFEVSGWPMGSELTWRLSSPGKPASNEALNPNGVHRSLMPPLSGQSTKDIMAQFTFTQEWFDKTMEMAPLMNAGNTNLRPYAQRGGKIILWTGLEDTIVQPATPISYFTAVQKEMGTKVTDNFMRLFLLPGVGHCNGGEGPSQIDTLSALMTWVEMKQEPKVLVAGKTVAAAGPGGGQPGGPQGGPPGVPGQAAGPAQGAPGGPNAPGAQAAVPNYPPYAVPSQPTTYTRPIYPYPMVAKYTGKGDMNDAANYESVKAALQVPQVFDHQTARLLGPNNQKFYHVENGNLVADKIN